MILRTEPTTSSRQPGWMSSQLIHPRSILINILGLEMVHPGCCSERLSERQWQHWELT
jgi:hypothetical protein